MVKYDKYSDKSVQSVLTLLKRQHEAAGKAGTKREYDILVDEVPVVFRTADLKKFTSYEKELNGETASVTIRLYLNKSHNCDKYILINKEGGKEEGSGLSGYTPYKQPKAAELGALVEEKVSAFKRDYELERLKEKHQEAEKENDSLRRENAELSQKLDNIQSAGGVAAMIGPFAGPLLRTIVSSNKALRESPLGAVLLTPDDNPPLALPQQAGQGGSASFEPVYGTGSGHDAEMLAFAGELQNSFSKTEFDRVLHIIGHLMRDKKLIEPVADWLQNNTNNN